jgi:phage terminase Nu1 subunit (DNA packaging protein)
MHTRKRLIDPDHLVDTIEAAELIGVSRARIKQLADAGVLVPLIQRKKVTLFDARAVQAYADERQARIRPRQVATA